tara:strand:+ start:627 stop:992 length:366 start_codon:yes stop_codon:yes gene_type:complete
MPLVKKRVSIASGATSEQILAGTTYEYVNPGTRIVVAAQDATSTYEAKTNLNFTVNNAEFARDALVSEKVTGEAFGWNGTGYVMNDMITTGAVRNRPIIQFTNTGSSSADIDVAVFIGSQG